MRQVAKNLQYQYILNNILVGDSKEESSSVKDEDEVNRPSLSDH